MCSGSRVRLTHQPPLKQTTLTDNKYQDKMKFLIPLLVVFATSDALFGLFDDDNDNDTKKLAKLLADKLRRDLNDNDNNNNNDDDDDDDNDDNDIDTKKLAKLVADNIRRDLYDNDHQEADNDTKKLAKLVADIIRRDLQDNNRDRYDNNRDLHDNNRQEHSQYNKNHHDAEPVRVHTYTAGRVPSRTTRTTTSFRNYKTKQQSSNNYHHY